MAPDIPVGACYDRMSAGWALVDLPRLAAFDGVSLCTTPTGLFLWGGIDPGGRLVEQGALRTPQGVWSTVGTSPLSARASACSATTENGILVWGGWQYRRMGDRDVASCNDGGLYDPETNQWSYVCPLKHRDNDSALWSAYTDGCLIVVLGRTAEPHTTLSLVRPSRAASQASLCPHVVSDCRRIRDGSSLTAHAYDFSTCMWENLPPPPLDLQDTILFAIGTTTVLGVRLDGETILWDIQSGKMIHTDPFPTTDTLVQKLVCVGRSLGRAVLVCREHGRLLLTTYDAEAGSWKPIPEPPFESRVDAGFSAAGDELAIVGGASRTHEGRDRIHLDGAILSL